MFNRITQEGNCLRALLLILFALNCHGVCFAESTSVLTEQPVLLVKPERPKRYVSWDEHAQLVERLAKKINESNWEFDHIICIARGGSLPGVLLSNLLDKEIGTIHARSYKKDGTQQKNLVISDCIAMTIDVLGKRVLLVDDLVDSGNSLPKVKEHIYKMHPNVQEIKTAVLWYKDCSTYKPDYFAEATDKDAWIVLPFEKEKLEF